jgi:HK97 family phage portal protein
LKWRQISISPNESQFLETRQFQRSEIAMLFGIPPHMIGDTEKSTSWGTGIEQQSIGFVTYTLRPWLTCIESVLSNLLPRGQYAQFNVDALLRGDQKGRYEAYLQARNAGWMNVNEIRELEDRAPIPNGDDYLQPLNYGPLGSDPLAAKTPPKPPTSPPNPSPNDGGATNDQG